MAKAKDAAQQDPMKDPGPDCDLCPRLQAFRDRYRQDEPKWFNAPVPSFGDPKAKLLIVGLAPGLRGANRTGRPFTGDWAGDLLYATLDKFGYSKGSYDARPDDGLTLKNCLITNAVRCVPPENKPTGEEIKTCRPFLSAQIKSMKNLRAILCLGLISHNSVMSAFGVRKVDHKFTHNARHDIEDLAVFDSYHCSRYNTNTGRLTEDMFHDVFRSVEDVVG